jgi:hypothetical protein
MITKTIDDLRTEVMTELLNHLPNLDLTEGTPERDLFVEAPISGQLIPAWDELIYVSKSFAPILFYNDLTSEDIKTYMANYNVAVLASTYSSGVVTFFTTVTPTTDITIESNTVVRTNSATPVDFVVDGRYVMYSSIASSYYNSVNNRWEINCRVKALNPGPAYRAGSGAVTVMVSSITGITGCVNTDAISGGQDEESLESALKRVVDKFQGRGLGSTLGLKAFVQSYVEAVNVVGAREPEMLRDEGYGGMIDFYIIGSESTTQTDTFTISSTGLDSPTLVTYTNNSVLLTKQPVLNVTSVIKNNIVLSTDYWDLTKDTGILKESTQGYDKITLTSAGIEDTGIGSSTGYFVDGDEIEVTYLYNSLLEDIETDLNTTTNHYMNRDYLVRSMTEVTIGVAFRFKELAGQIFSTVSAAVELDVASFINDILNNGSVERADIVGVAKQNSYVDNIDLDSVVLTATGGGVVTAQGDVTLGKNEYPAAGTITLTRWTN